MNQWWQCPKCKQKIDFTEQMSDIFDYDNGEAYFDPKSGLYLHTILCSCGAYWTMGISEMKDRDKKNNKE